jgi:DNA-binding NtrC family response regulator
MASVAFSLDNETKPRALAPVEAPGTCEPLILVVEDDSSIRRFICALLKWAAKARVIEAADPSAALSAMRRMARPIDVLISDIDLGSEKTGVDLAHEIAASNPGVRVLLISGGRAPKGGILPGWRFLEKPFAIAEILDFVNEALGSVKSAQTSVKNVKNRAAA